MNDIYIGSVSTSDDNRGFGNRIDGMVYLIPEELNRSNLTFPIFDIMQYQSSELWLISDTDLIFDLILV